MKHILTLTLLLALAAPAPAAAAEVAMGSDRYAVTVRRVDLRPATPAAARRTIIRLGEAAESVCGASGASLREVRLALRRSACWHESMAEVVSRIDSPLLSHAWRVPRRSQAGR